MTTKPSQRKPTTGTRARISKKSASPTELKRVRQAKYVRLLLAGYNVRDAAIEVGVTPRTAREWRTEDPEFEAMLLEAEDRVVQTLLEDGLKEVRENLINMGPRAAEVLKAALESEDPRVALSAANTVLRFASPSSLNVQVSGLESHLASSDARPAAGD